MKSTIFRQLLFCPSNKQELFDKAIQSEADLIIFDWEDSVSFNQKLNARETFYNWYINRKDNSKPIGVRLNDFNTIEGIRDILFLYEKKIYPDYIMLSKVHSADYLMNIKLVLNDFQGLYIVLVESAKGISNLKDVIREHHSELAFTMIGSADLSLDLGCELSREALAFSCGQVLNTCCQYKIPVMDYPNFDFNNENEFIKDTEFGKSIGFTGRGAIHPRQLSMINRIYKPSVKELVKSKMIIRAVKNGVVSINGVMFDEAMAKKAQQTILLAKKFIKPKL